MSGPFTSCVDSLAVVLCGVVLTASPKVQLPQAAPRAVRPSTAEISGQIAAATASLQDRNYAAAMDSFELVLRIEPTNATARNGETEAATRWAAEQVHNRQPERAMSILERALQQIPDSPKLLVSFGLEAIALGQLPIADQALHAADKLRPGDPDITYALARLELEEQHMPEAERDLKAYVALRPSDASAYFGLGHVYAMEQRPEEARKAFETSIRLQPQQTESYFQLGELDLKAQQDDAAAQMFRRVLARQPEHAGALTGMGQLELRAKHYAEAEQFLAKAEQSDPAYATPHYFRGLALAKLGRKNEAQQELQRGDSRPHAAVPGSGQSSASPSTETQN